jgi:DNA-binding LacI/PurR family transcriptional regulator
MATQKEVADHLGMDLETVRHSLNETPWMTSDKAMLDKVFGAARKLGYDFRKLKIGKRMEVRKTTIEDIIRHIDKHPDWTRDEILDHLRTSIGLVKRVQKKAFPQEFPTEE